MVRRTAFFAALLLLVALVVRATAAQNAETATLKSIHADNLKHLSPPQLIALTGLTVGATVAKPDLQAAADRLVQTGLFSNVNYSFQSREDGLYLTFKLVEAPRLPAYFDNFPWFADSELTDAIRKVLPFYDRTLPEGGATVDQVGAILTDLVASRGLQTVVEHGVIANPLGEGTVQEYRIADVVLQISKLEFGDSTLASNKALQQHLSEIQGKAYSRMVVDLFLAEQVKPIYLERGYLRVKLGPPEIRLSGNPNQKLPDQIPVFVPVTPGAIYTLKSTQWSGNTVLSVFTLTGLLGVKSGAVANGLAIENGWEQLREQYAHLGYLEAQVEPLAEFDEQAHTVSYIVTIREGRPYKMGKLVVTGLSPTAERRLRAAFPNLSGEIFDKQKFEDILSKLEVHHEQIFVDLPVHYETVGHWLQRDESAGTVDVLLDFK